MSIRLLAPLSLFLLAPATVAAPQAPAPTEEAAFLAGLAAIEAEVASRTCPNSRASLTALLAAHESRAYVRVHAPRVVEALQLSAFWSTHESPDPRQLVSGEFLSFDPSGRSLRLRYTPTTKADFVRLESSSAERAGDLVLGQSSATYLHPLVFAGPYTIEIRNAHYPQPGIVEAPLPAIFVGFEDGDGYVCSFGLALTTGPRRYSAAARLLRTKDGKVEVLDSLDPGPAVAGKRADFRVRVERNSISVSYDGKKFLSASKPDGVFGQIAIKGLFDCEEIILSGQTEPSWILGLVDKAIDRQWTAFAAKWDTERELPAWLATKACGAFEPPSLEAWGVPGPTSPAQSTSLAAAKELFATKQWTEGVAFAEKLDTATTTEEFRRWLAALFLARAEAPERSLPERALRECGRVCELQPGFRPARILHAELAGRLGRTEEALAELRALIEQDAADSVAPALLGRWLLRKGRHAELALLVRLTAESGRYSSEMHVVNTALSKVQRGPTWSTRHEHVSKNYRVVSDINRATCIQIADRLETALANVQRRMGSPKTARSAPYLVYVFSGQASYQRYVASTMFTSGENTAGMYSPVLKQLVLWNVPDRDDLLRTARHEGFHQYFDSVADDPPLWLNEGLAEYFADADYTKAGAAEIQLNRKALGALRDRPRELAPLRSLLAMVDRSTFYAGDVSLNYAEAWAFVHFLQNSTPENQKLFADLIERLQSGSSARDALNAAFPEAEVARLAGEFARYLAKLIG